MIGAAGKRVRSVMASLSPAKEKILIRGGRRGGSRVKKKGEGEIHDMTATQDPSTPRLSSNSIVQPEMRYCMPGHDSRAESVSTQRRMDGRLDPVLGGAACALGERPLSCVALWPHPCA